MDNRGGKGWGGGQRGGCLDTDNQITFHWTLNISCSKSYSRHTDGPNKWQSYMSITCAHPLPSSDGTGSKEWCLAHVSGHTNHVVYVTSWHRRGPLQRSSKFERACLLLCHDCDHERDKPSVLGCMEKVWIFTGLVWKILPHLDVSETWILCVLQEDSCLEFKKTQNSYIQQLLK